MVITRYNIRLEPKVCHEFCKYTIKTDSIVLTWINIQTKKFSEKGKMIEKMRKKMLIRSPFSISSFRSYILKNLYRTEKFLFISM